MTAPASFGEEPPRLVEERRYPAFDALRACAMELGLVLHAAVPYTQRCPDTWAACDPSRSGLFDLMNTLIHAMRMPVFFLMSGFFAALLIGRIGTGPFIRHRLRRIALPFVVACLVLVPITRSVWIYGQFARPEEALPGRFMPSLVAHFEEIGLALFETVWHLWFLEYLLILTLAFLFVRLAARQWPVLGRFAGLDRLGRMLVSKYRVAWLALPAMLSMHWMAGWNVDGVSALKPSGHLLAYYAIFFFAGVLLFRARGQIDRLRQGWRLHLVGAVFVVLPLMMWLSRGVRDVQSRLSDWPVLTDVAGRSLSGVLTCLLLFAMVGLFVERFDQPRPTQRYLADAAYFVYLVHFPLIALLGIGMAHTSWPAVLKFALVLASATAALLATYHFGVRHRAIGRFLHGPRERPS